MNPSRMALWLMEKVCFKSFKIYLNFVIICESGEGIGTINGRETLNYNLYIACEYPRDICTCTN